jgi:NADH-quinone oxidoreductase subunit C
MKRDTTQALLEQFGDAITTTDNFRGEETLIVSPSKIVEVCQFLRDTAGLEYKMLMDITGVDYYPQETQWGRFAICYHLLSIRWNHRLRLKVYWSDGDDPIPSVTGVWSSANWEEREAYDMFGIEFSGHPDLRRILMPDDWQGFPQRRDYPLGYETVQFSFNFDEVNRHKPFAKE